MFGNSNTALAERPVDNFDEPALYNDMRAKHDLIAANTERPVARRSTGLMALIGALFGAGAGVLIAPDDVQVQVDPNLDPTNFVETMQMVGQMTGVDTSSLTHPTQYDGFVAGLDPADARKVQSTLAMLLCFC